MKNKQDIVKILGSLIREERKKQALTIEELHLKSGVAFAQISLFELGKTDIATSTFYRIASALDINLETLIKSKIGFSKKDLDILISSIDKFSVLLKK